MKKQVPIDPAIHAELKKISIATGRKIYSLVKEAIEMLIEREEVNR